MFRLESHFEEQSFLEVDDVSILDRQCYQDYFQIKVSFLLGSSDGQNCYCIETTVGAPYFVISEPENPAKFRTPYFCLLMHRLYCM